MPGTVLCTGTKRVNETDKPTLTVRGSSGPNKEVKQVISQHEGSKQYALTSRVRGPPQMGRSGIER